MDLLPSSLTVSLPHRVRALATVAVAAVLLSLTVAPARAQAPASPTRADYVAQADPICQAAFRTKLPQPKDKHDLKGYVRLFDAMGNRIGAMTDRLERIPKPPADVTGLTNWLDALQSWSRGANKAAAALRHRNLRAYKASLRQMNRAQKIRRDAVKAFGFQICA